MLLWADTFFELPLVEKLDAQSVSPSEGRQTGRQTDRQTGSGLRRLDFPADEQTTKRATLSVHGYRSAKNRERFFYLGTHMRTRTAFLSGGLALLVVAALWLDLFSQHVTAPQTGNPASETQVLSTLLPNGVQQVLIVDTRLQTLAVYHVDPAMGKIQLRSVRNLQMDLAVEDFNTLEPLPREMRLLKQ